MTNRRQFLACTASALAASALPWAGSHAQAWPSRPIRIIVPLPPGGGSDYLARLLAERLQPVLGQPLIVENRVGADGRIGIEHAMRQAPDGHTMLIIANAQVVQPALFPKLPYDITVDFDPVSLIAHLAIVLLVHQSTPVNSVREYIALAKARPGYVTFGSSGFGSPFQLGGELLKSMAGVDMLHVPYKGSSQVTTALLAGEVMSAFAPMHSAFLPHIQSGRLRALGMVTAKRSPLLPEVPTIAESAPLPGYALESWMGVVMPAGTPRAIIERFSSAIAALVQDPAFAQAKLLPEGWDPVGSTPGELAAFIKAGIAKYAKIVKDAKIVVE